MDNGTEKPRTSTSPTLFFSNTYSEYHKKFFTTLFRKPCANTAYFQPCNALRHRSSTDAKRGGQQERQMPFVDRSPCVLAGGWIISIFLFDRVRSSAVQLHSVTTYRSRGKRTARRCSFALVYFINYSAICVSFPIMYNTIYNIIPGNGIDND